MNSIVVGVLAIQGDVEENIAATKSAMNENGIDGDVKIVKYKKDLESIDGLIIPGGESTVVSGLLLIQSKGTFELLKNKITNGMPVLGTCAGMIMLSKRSFDRVVGDTRQKLLEILNIAVERNAFGRQNESFESDIKITVLGDVPFKGVFIRAPVVSDLDQNVEVLARFNDKVVAIRQNNIIGTSFHPELSGDSRLHGLFIKSIISYKSTKESKKEN